MVPFRQRALRVGFQLCVLFTLAPSCARSCAHACGRGCHCNTPAAPPCPRCVRCSAQCPRARLACPNGTFTLCPPAPSLSLSAPAAPGVGTYPSVPSVPLWTPEGLPKVSMPMSGQYTPTPGSAVCSPGGIFDALSFAARTLLFGSCRCGCRSVAQHRGRPLALPLRSSCGRTWDPSSLCVYSFLFFFSS